MTRRLASLVSNPVLKGSPDLILPVYALEHIDGKVGRLVPDAVVPSVETQNAILVQPGDVVFGKLRPYLAKSLHFSQSAAVSPELLVLRPGPEIYARFLYYLTLSKSFVDWADATSYGVKMPRTSWKELREYRLDPPPKASQERIARWLDTECARLDELLHEQAHLASLLEEHSRIAVKRAVTGADVPGPRRQDGPYWLGETPAAWTPEKVAWRFRTGSGTTPASGNPRYYGGEHPWLTTSECRDGIVSSTIKTVTDAALSDYSTLKYYPAGSVVVAMYGATIGRLAVLGTPMTVNQACCVLYEPTTLDPWFTFYWLWAHRDEIAAMGAGGGQPNISQETVRQLRIPAPSLDEQRAIVRHLRQVLQQTEVTLQEIATQQHLLNERRQALITAAVTGQISVEDRRGAA